MTNPDPSEVEVVARELAKRRVYEGYDAETRTRLIEREVNAARRDARAAIAALDAHRQALSSGETGDG